ncbi:MAG TPA: CAP domain-containing protein [Thermoleophilaceae bacterium]|nr:CAP domain-containing protein [Thermoleophilaceae bacterium]
MLGAVNAARTPHGLAPFRGSPSLHSSASAYARWMLRSGHFGHVGRIRASGRFSMLGEVLAWHSGRRPQVLATVRRWMGSPPHRALILHPGFRWLGAGMARGGGTTAWVLHFGG